MAHVRDLDVCCDLVCFLSWRPLLPAANDQLRSADDTTSCCLICSVRQHHGQPHRKHRAGGVPGCRSGWGPATADASAAAGAAVAAVQSGDAGRAANLTATALASVQWIMKVVF